MAYCLREGLLGGGGGGGGQRNLLHVSKPNTQWDTHSHNSLETALWQSTIKQYCHTKYTSENKTIINKEKFVFVFVCRIM